MTPSARLAIVLGVGNLLMQDDGIGIRMLGELAAHYELPVEVRLIDVGVAGFAWLDELAGAELLLVVDAVRGSEPPGTLRWLSPDELTDRFGPILSAHEVALADMLAAARLLGKLPPTRILGVQVGGVQPLGLELSLPLRLALPKAAAAMADELNRSGFAVRRKEPPEETPRRPSPA